MSSKLCVDGLDHEDLKEDLLMATVKRVRLMNRVMQTVHKDGVIVSPDCDVKQVYAVKGTIISSLTHLGSKLKVEHQGSSVWRVV